MQKYIIKYDEIKEYPCEDEENKDKMLKYFKKREECSNIRVFKLKVEEEIIN